MENPSSSVVDKEGTGALNLALHPLVLINISDHWTRQRVQHNQANPRVIGALMGKQTGRDVEIFDSFELVYKLVEGLVLIDMEYLTQKQEQFKKVFPNYDFLGWYSTGEKVTQGDIEVHKQLMEVNESPLYLLLNTLACVQTTAKDLPISVFESELHMVNDQPTTLFVKINYKIETGEAERISVDHVARVLTSGTQEGSSLSSHLNAIFNAITMLSIRIQILKRFLQATKEGKISADRSVLRRIASLCNQIPSAIDPSTFKSEFLKDYNDALLVTYLSTLTKGANAMNELIDKFNVSFERQGGRKRGPYL